MLVFGVFYQLTRCYPCKVGLNQRALPQPHPASLFQILMPNFFYFFWVSVASIAFQWNIHLNSIQACALASPIAAGGKVQWPWYFLQAQAACGPSNPAQ